ncbi:MAG: glycosyl transferase family 1, partial [Oscillochloris sp.]|nr:glycosyl transferase family 1 [Oscillochloris sp.]
VGEAEGDLILAYCRLLLDRPGFAEALGARARAFVATEHRLEIAALGYARFLAHLYGWPALRRLRERPLWDLEEPERQRPGGRGQGAGDTPPDPAPRTPDLVGAAARALAELGLDEGNADLLQIVAQRIGDVN